MENLRSLVPHSPRKVAAMLVVMIALVGGLDYVTGYEVRVTALYFLPLALAAWRLGMRGAILGAILANAVWLFTQYTSGVRYSYEVIWLVNFVTQGAAFVSVALLVAALAQALQRERSISRTDALTGLLNRRAFLEQSAIVLDAGRRRRWPMALAFIDLDGFKSANDRFGHAFGDLILRQCAALMQAELRSSDLLARLGGDEFVILLPDSGASTVRGVLERLRLQIAALPALTQAGVTVSVGAVVDEAAALPVEALLTAADAYMYQVKQSGKDQVRVRIVGEDA